VAPSVYCGGVAAAGEVAGRPVGGCGAPVRRRRPAGAGELRVRAEALEQTLSVEEFLAELPRRLWDKLSTMSVQHPAVRGLVEILLSLRAEARARGVEPATPVELRGDLIVLLAGLDKQARTGRLPPYLPTDADVTALSRTVWARPQVRTGPGGDDPGGQTGGGVYRLPVDRLHDSEPPRLWTEIAAEYPRLMVLADPGLGKSWLVRTETLRLCEQALDRLARGLGPVVIPVPLRCNQLAAAAGPDLASRAAGFLVAQRLLAERSCNGVAAMVYSGEAVVLLDALDELTTTESGRVWELVSSWAEKAGDRARCVITSRIAGYTGSPLRDARVVEMQAFTCDDVEAAIDARLPPAAAARLWDWLADPATGTIARIPLLLALLCSLAAEPGGEDLPATRGQLFERILRRFLTGEHRRPDDPSRRYGTTSRYRPCCRSWRRWRAPSLPSPRAGPT
jgi:hypothetical protein